MNRRRLVGAVAAGAGVALYPGDASAVVDEELAARVRPFLDRALAAGSPSVVCGVVSGARRHVAGASQEGPAPDGRTVFQLGSIGKTLTATALARAGCRRLHRRYERKADHFLAFTSIACTFICYRRLTK
ncbi:hypothetical protein E1265_30185 [Streptomyces sp. 8K308]|nr:hypothetical protein E1265_30185 [Streptomyces sp. 8K308]